MDALIRAAQLRREADTVMSMIRLREIVEPYSRIVPTGSYFLDVMVYPDIDLYLMSITHDQAQQICTQLAAAPLVCEVKFEESHDPTLPGGLYIKPRITYGDWGRPWKIDIWAVDQAIIDRKMVDMLRFQAQMTPALREQIIRYKAAIVTARHRTPMYSGYFIYKAFIDEGMSNPQQVTQYLVEHGIDMT
jgi:hypothetical protein